MESLAIVIILTLLTTSPGKTTDYRGRNLTRVPIDSIPPETHTLKLSDNKIIHLGCFNTTPEIRYLSINNNKVNIILPQTFKGLLALVYLDMDRNDIVSLRQFTFSTIATLSQLILSNNYISHISENAFYGLENLECLELLGNRLSAFPMRSIEFIPSEHLYLVSLRLNSITQVPMDVKTIRPETSYDLRGNPLRCPAESNNSAYTDRLNAYYYIVNIRNNRSFVRRSFFRKETFRYFGVHPSIFKIFESIEVVLPHNGVPEILKLHFTNSYYWDTPTGRRHVKSFADNISVEDSGVYTFVADRGDRKLKCDIVFCMMKKPIEKRQNETTSAMPRNEHCPTFTNKSCCLSGFLAGSTDKNLCDPDNITSETKNAPNVVLIVAIAFAIFLLVLFPTLMLCLRKRSANQNNTHTASATLQVGVQAMSVCVNIHAIPNIAKHQINEDLDPNSFSLRRFQLAEEAQFRSQAVTQILAADSTLTTRAEVHHYSNDETSPSVRSGDTEEGLDHCYASAAPPPLPVCDDEDSSSPQASDHSDLLEAAPGQPEETESDEEEMADGIAAANAIYEDTNLNQSEATSEHDNRTPHYYAVDGNQIETISSFSRNSLYGQQHQTIAATEGLDTLYESLPTTTSERNTAILRR